MALVQNLKFHDYQFAYQVSVGTWKWSVRLDVSQATPSYSVRDIISPYGLLRDSIPIPGVIIEAMAESIGELKENFRPNILLGPPTSVIFYVDEGRGYSQPIPVIVTNDGVYGSILGASITSSAGYVRVSPSSVGNLAINESGEFNVEVNSTDLLNLNSPYNEVITVQDPTAINNPQSIPVVINVRPKSTINLSPIVLNFNVTKPLIGPFPAVPSQTFLVQNTGPLGSVLEYDIRRLTNLCNWLTTISPSFGTLNSGQSQSITVGVTPTPNMLQGVYTETLRVSGYSSNSYMDITIQLVVS